MKGKRSKPVYFFVIALLILAMLACGSLTTQQVEEAVVPTSAGNVEEIISSDATGEPESEPVASPTVEPPTPTETKPVPTPEPTVPPATPTPVPEPETIKPMEVIAQGYGQDGRDVGYSFIVMNPNAATAYEGVQYQIAALDASGTIVDTDTGYLEVVLPNQQLGVGGSLFVNEGVTVSTLDVQVSPGEPVARDPVPTFTVEMTSYKSDEYFSTVAGIIHSPYDEDLSELRVSAVLYDETGAIVGGGYSYVNFILAASSTGVEVQVTASDQAISAEIYPTITNLTLLGAEREVPEGAQSLSLLQQGFGQDGNRVGYGFTLENPNSNYSLENSRVRIAFYAEDGAVLSVDESYLKLIVPGQILGVGGDVFVGEGESVHRVEAQLYTGDYVEVSEELAPFTSENVAYSEGSFTSTVSGFIVNPYTQDMTDLRVSAIAYDESGQIIGGGYTFLDFVTASGKSAIEVTVYTSSVPASVELYAIPTTLTWLD